jgi:hypothetical protein
VALGIGQHAREEVINWILDVRFIFLTYLFDTECSVFSLRSCQPYHPHHHQSLFWRQSPLFRLTT